MNLPFPLKRTIWGTWTLTERLGRGGNGEVWRALDNNGASAAIKFLTKIKPIAYARFKAEVKVMAGCGVSGVVPILESHLPEDPATSRPWYAMPVGKPLVEYLDGTSLRQKVASLALIAETMAKLHAQEIVHRDIKPSNMIAVNDNPCIGDFGLVYYPNKEDLTADREEIGPRCTMAPEVRHYVSRANLRPADVYSLAKTLWMFIAENNKGFEGQYAADSSVSIGKFDKYSFTAPLDELLSTATEHEPAQRPTMDAFAKGLRNWLRIDSAFPERNRLEWIDVQNRLFPLTPPARASWINIDSIVQVLNILGARSNMNHLFFPGGGGLDLSSAIRSHREDGCIELITNGSSSLLRPKRLMFESFAADPQWNYFRLEADELSPSEVYEDIEDIDEHGYEELTDVGRHTYADRSCWDAGEYEGRSLPKNSRTLSRYFRGAFVIFQKTSRYNRIGDTYDGRHNKVNAEEFRQYIEKIVNRIQDQSLSGATQ